MSKPKMQEQLRRGWTTGDCATAAAAAALHGLLHQKLLQDITINLPKIKNVTFALKKHQFTSEYGFASVIKDAGDDPDITDGIEVCVDIRPMKKNHQHTPQFHAGAGVGVVTMGGLPIAIGEPAITPKPREMIIDNIKNIIGHDKNLAYDITISIPNGQEIAEKTWNKRLGIVGGLSILGTTGIVIPYSCSAWIHSIHRGIDVARANGFSYIGAATGKTSLAVLENDFHLPVEAIIDMGDFIGGMVKYLNKKPVNNVHIVGGIGKMAKCAQGAMDLHSRRSTLNQQKMINLLRDAGFQGAINQHLQNSGTAAQFYECAMEDNINIAPLISQRVCQNLHAYCPQINFDITIIDRQGNILN